MIAPGHKPPRDLTDVIFIGAGGILACGGLLYLTGGITVLITCHKWVDSPWINGAKVFLNPAAPADAFGLTSTDLNPVVYWLVLVK